MRRVVVTGIGVVSPIGIGLPAFWGSLKEGRSGIGPVTGMPPRKLGVTIAAQIHDYAAEDHFEAKRLSMLDRVSQFGIVAAREAVAMAGLDVSGPVAQRTATIIGVGVGGMHTLDEGYQRLYGDGVDRLHPFTIPRLMASAAASHVSMELGLTGPAFVTTSACASANHAIGTAFHMVRSGMAEAAVTGGAEASLSFGALKAWEALRVTSNDTCRPFSKNRSGMVLGEGSAVLVLEHLEHAQARGAEILGEIVGFGMSADAKDITAPDAAGCARAIQAALADGGLYPEDIGYVNAHGTGTAANDATEAAAIRIAFGGHADRLAVSASKSMFGHALGAAGALEAAATVMALRHAILPPTMNFTEADPACDLDVVPNEARTAEVGAALSNSFAFGGLNAVLAFRRV